MKGAKPGELLAKPGARFKLDRNLETAKARSITIPQSDLVRADQVIE